MQLPEVVEQLKWDTNRLYQLRTALFLIIILEEQEEAFMHSFLQEQRLTCAAPLSE